MVKKKRIKKKAKIYLALFVVIIIALIIGIKQYNIGLKAFTIKYIENMYGFFGYGLWLVFDKKTGELVARAGIENRSQSAE